MCIVKDVCYSLTQSHHPTGSLADMSKTDGTGLVIKNFTGTSENPGVYQLLGN